MNAEKECAVLQFLIKAEAFISRRFPLLILVSVIVGAGFPSVFSFLNQLTVPMFAFITFYSSLGGSFRDMALVARHPLPVISVWCLMHVVLPPVVLLAGMALFPEAPLFTTGLVLEFSIPTGVASLMWVGMAGGNLSLCLALVLLDTLLSPVVIPLTLQVLLGSVVEMDPWGMMGNLMIMVAIPAVAAMTLFQLTGGRSAEYLKPRLGAFSKTFMLLVVVANGTDCAPFLRHLTPQLILVIAAVFCLCVVGFLAGYWMGRLQRRDYPTITTMTLATGLRNISAGAVLASQYFPPDVLFPVALTPLFLQVMASIVLQILQRTKPARAWAASQAEHPA